MFDIEEELKKLPDKPGVYIMHDKNDIVIYVGKAVSLKNRVRQYFRKNNKTIRIQNMVSLISYFEYIVTDTEAEALLLECNLIKKYMPKFNVLLKDDKTYPYIKINIKAEYPDVYVTRKKLKDDAKYFGPYSSMGIAKEMVEFIKAKFKIRQCKTFKYKNKACLNYQIKRCFAPCIGYITKEEYRKQIDEIIDLLEGKTEKLLNKLYREMEEESKKTNFENAAYIRDKILVIERISERQKISNISENDIDVIGISRNDAEICIEIFFVRNSKMIGREHFFFKEFLDETNAEILSNFIKQYYLQREVLPNKIMIRENIDDRSLLESLLTERIDRKVEIKIPQKGEKLRLVEMAEKNATITLNNKIKDEIDILKELKSVLCLQELPNKIECFDISNISGTDMVAGMCVMVNGKVNKSLSRRLKIKTVNNQDDPKCIYEAILRRLKYSTEDSGFGNLPNLILVDGGITQIKAAKRAVNELNFSIPVFGIVKNDKHQTRALIDENRSEFLISDNLKNAITVLQDVVHSVAIGYHRKLRDSKITKSVLDDIEGIGVVKKTRLLKEFGSIDKILEAEEEDIAKVKGINIELAKKIKNAKI